MALADYQAQLIEFMVKAGALTFGDFTTKSGRKTPYFINAGHFDDGEKIGRLGEFYASHIKSAIRRPFNCIFGPAYKGVPLCVTTAISLHSRFGVNCGYTFDRKEAKAYADKGKLVGHKIKPGDSVVIVEDVITAGTTLKEVVPMITSELGAEVAGVIVLVDRCERGASAISALNEVESTLGIKVHPIVNIHQIVEHLGSDNPSGFKLPEEIKARIAAYLQEYSV
jgi:orotate phosphoribosyltransferase